MSDGQILLRAAERLIPSYSSLFEWGNTWKRPLSEGVALEWATLAAIVAEGKIRGWGYTFPVLDVSSGKSLFPLRNEIPLHHGAQAGHSAAAQSGPRLEDRFLQAFTPKVLLEKSGTYYSLFREGCPYHRVMCGAPYGERPDILLLPGRPTPGFPRLVQDEEYIEFSFDLAATFTISGQLRVVNAPSPYTVRRDPPGVTSLAVTGIVECSVNKPAGHATDQLQKYDSLFASPPMVLVTGNDLSSLDRPNAVVDLASGDVDALERELRVAAALVLDTFAVV